MNKIKELYAKIHPVLFTGRTFAIIKTMLFVGGSIFIGLWIGLKLFFPDEFILSKINKELFVKDMGLIADDVSISMFGNITFYNGQFTERGERVFTFGKITVKPSIFDVLRKRMSGEIIINDIDNQGGSLSVKADPGEEICYSFRSRDLPLSMVRGFLKDISFSGILTGEGNLCVTPDNKHNGAIFLVSDDIIFRGKLPTVMGPVDVGRIDLGSLDFSTEIKEGRAEITRLVAKGLITLDVAGSININPRTLMASRLDVDVRIDINDMGKVQENPALAILMGLMTQYKLPNKEGSYAMLMRGPASKPMINRAPDVRKGSEKSADKDETKNRAQKVRSKMAARRKSVTQERKTEKSALATEENVKSETPEEESSGRNTKDAQSEEDASEISENRSRAEAQKKEQEETEKIEREEEEAQRREEAAQRREEEEAQRREEEAQRREEAAQRREEEEAQRREEAAQRREEEEAQRREEEVSERPAALVEDPLEPESGEVEDEE
jgi:type II secretion system protein N